MEEGLKEIEFGGSTAVTCPNCHKVGYVDLEKAREAGGRYAKCCFCPIMVLLYKTKGEDYDSAFQNKKRRLIFEKRTENLRATMKGEFFMEFFLLYTPESIFYFTGFRPHEGTSFVVIFADEKGFIVTDGRYEEQAKLETKDSFFDIFVTQPGQGIIDLLSEKLPKNKGFLELHIEQHPECLFPAKHYIKLKEVLPRVEIDFPLRTIFDIRSAKEPQEVFCIRSALKISELVLYEVLDLIKEGITELDISAEISYRHKKHGAEGDAFPSIVASGQNSVLVHATPGRKVIERGDLIQFDMGCIYNGYCSDISRVVVVGFPTERQYEIYHKVLQIQIEMLSMIKPGINLIEPYKAYKTLVEEAGFEVQHSLGHGVGLNIHEFPNASQPPPEYGEFIAKSGQILTIEPGIYVPGEFWNKN